MKTEEEKNAGCLAIETKYKRFARDIRRHRQYFLVEAGPGLRSARCWRDQWNREGLRPRPSHVLHDRAPSQNYRKGFCVSWPEEVQRVRGSCPHLRCRNRQMIPIYRKIKAGYTLILKLSKLDRHKII
jgi:hypothetical protein